MPTRTLGVVVVLAACALLSACASLPNPNTTAEKLPAQKMSGGLLVVRLEGRYEALPSLIVDITSSSGENRTSVAGRLQRGIPGRYADYLFPLALPPERYVLTAVREFSASTSNAAPPSVVLYAPFVVKSGPPDYLGRLVLPTPSNQRMRLEDQYDEDTLFFRTSIAGLRSVTIERNLISGEVIAAAASNAEVLDVLVLKMDLKLAIAAITFAPITLGANMLLAPAARPAFARFLKLKPPRAFATNEAGDQGWAKGPNSVEQAMHNCAAAQGRTCRLFAVDDTLIARGACAAVQSGSDENPIQADCVPHPPTALIRTRKKKL